MKNTKKIINLISAFAIITGSLLIYSFTKPAQYLYHEGYTMKMESFRVPADGSSLSKLSEIDKGNCEFTQEETEYNLYIYDQGKFEMTHKTLAAPNVQSLGEGQVMSITSNANNVSGYTAKGALVAQFEQDPEAIQEVDKLLEILKAEAQNSGAFDLTQCLNDAKSQGMAVVGQGKDYVTLSATYPSGVSEEFTLDTQTGVKTSSKKTVNGELFMVASYGYDASPKPKLIEESKVYYETSSASGVKMKKIVTTTFTNHKEDNFIK